jgi:hypothetical protein
MSPGGASKNLASANEYITRRGGKGAIGQINGILRMEVEGEDKINLALTSPGLKQEASTSTD